MPVDTKHRLYDDMLSQWTRCRDAVEGTDAVKKRGPIYLPRLTKQIDPEYEAYKARALWYDASSRTLDGLTGAIFRKPHTYEVPIPLDEGKAPCTVDGRSLDDLCFDTTREVLTTGRAGILVDVAAAGGNPYFAPYKPEDIINWQTEVIDGEEVLVLLVLREHVWVLPENSTDGYSREERDRYRVYMLVDGYVEVTVHTRAAGQGFGVTDVTFPVARGSRLERIPFVFINAATGSQTKPGKSPMLGVVDVNFSHYRTSADLEHGAHYTALPTAWVAGFDTESELVIGSQKAWVSKDPSARAGFLEFTGGGLQTLENRLSRKEEQMAILGARLLSNPRPGVEAAESIRLRQSGENSALVTVTDRVSEGMTRAVEFYSAFAGDQGEATVQLNKDFLDVVMEPSQIVALIQATQAGKMSTDTFLWNLYRGELLPPGVTPEDEKNKLELEAPDLDVEPEPGEGNG